MGQCRPGHIADAVRYDAAGQQRAARIQMVFQLIEQTDDDIRDDIGDHQVRPALHLLQNIALSQGDDILRMTA